MSKKKLLILIICIALALAVAGISIWLFTFYLPQAKRTEELRQAMADYYDSKVAQFAEENERIAPDSIDVVFLGDSLTDGYDVAAAYPQYTVLNRGIGGDTTDGLLERMHVSAYAVRPKVVVMLIGANNMHAMLDNYEDLLKGLQSNLPDTKVVLLSLTSMSGNWAHNNREAAYNNTFIKRWAQQYGYSFVDLYTPLFDETTGELRAEYTVDGGHLTSAGYQVVTDAITPVLTELLGH